MASWWEDYKKRKGLSSGGSESRTGKTYNERITTDEHRQAAKSSTWWEDYKKKNDLERRAAADRQRAAQSASRLKYRSERNQRFESANRQLEENRSRDAAEDEIRGLFRNPFSSDAEWQAGVLQRNAERYKRDLPLYQQEMQNASTWGQYFSAHRQAGESQSAVKHQFERYQQAAQKAEQDRNESNLVNRPAQWQAENLTPQEIEQRLAYYRSEAATPTVTDKDREEHSYLYPEAALQKDPHGARFDERLVEDAGQDAIDAAYRPILTEQEKAAVEEADRQIIEEKTERNYENVQRLLAAQKVQTEAFSRARGEELIDEIAQGGEAADRAKTGKAMFEQQQARIAADTDVEIKDDLESSRGAYTASQKERQRRGYILGYDWDNVPEDRKQAVYALYTEDPEKAIELAKYYIADVRQAEDKERQEWYAQSGWTAALGLVSSAAAHLGAAVDPFGEVGQELTRRGDNALAGGSQWADAATGYQKIPEWVPVVGGKGAGDFYQTVGSVVQSAAIAAPAVLAGRYDKAAAEVVSKLGLALMGSSAAASDYRESVAAGMDEDRAKLHALAAGVEEALFEEVSLDKLVEMDTSGGLKAALKNWLVQSGIEGSEELATSIANRITDEMISGAGQSKVERRASELIANGMSSTEAHNQAESEWMTDTLYDGFSGFLSGGMMTGGNYALKGLANLKYKAVNAAETRKVQKQAGAAVSRSEGSVEALQAYAKDKGIEIKTVETAEQNAEQDGQETAQNSYSSRDYRSISDTNSKVVQSIRNEVRGKTVQEQQAVRDSLVEKYGEGIAPVVNHAISVETAARVRQEYGNVDSIQAARNRAVSEIKDESLRRAVSDGYDSAAYSLAASQDGEDGMNAMSRYIQQRRNTGSGSEMSMNATVTAQDGSTKAIAITGMSEDGKRVSLADGSEVAVKDLQADADTTSAIQQLADLDLGDDATKVLQAYQQSGVAGTEGYRWLMDYATAYNQGRTRQISLEQAAQRSSLDERTVMDAYTLGQQAANRETQAGLEKLKNLPKRKGANGRTANIDTTEIKGKTMSKSELEQFELANQYAQALGVDMTWFSSKEKDGKFVGKNGAYENGKIYMDIHAGRNFAADLTSGILATMGHELTHFQQQYAPEEYQAIKEFLFEQIVKSSPDGEARLERLIWEKQRRSGYTLSRKAAEDEVVADACQKMLRDSKAVHDFANQQPEAANGLVRWLDKWFKKVRSIFGRGGNYSEEAQLMDSLEQDVKAAFGELWDKALKQAAKVHDEVGNIEKTTTEGESKEESKAQNSDRDAEYLELAKDPEKNESRLQEMVDEAAKRAGFTSPMLFHGTDAFGFTTIKTSKDVHADGFSFWAANKESAAGTYTRYGKTREIESEIDYEETEEAIEERSADVDEAIDDFRYLIDRTFSEWFYGQHGNEVIRRGVDDSNPDPGSGDGVYDFLVDQVADAFNEYSDSLPETYEDFADFQERSEEWEKIEDAIAAIEGAYSALSEIQSNGLVGGIYELYANTDNMYVVDAKGAAWNALHPEGLPKIERGEYKNIPYKTRDVANWARDNGYDGVIFKNIKDNGAYGRTESFDVYAFFNPQAQVKSADPVTYDDQGNVIPLSERFNEANEDIRYSERDELASDNQIHDIANQSGETVGVQDGNGHLQFSQRTWRESGKEKMQEYLDERVRKYEANHNDPEGMHPDDAKALMAAVQEQYDALDEIVRQQPGNYKTYEEWADAEVETDIFGNPVFSWLKANGDYGISGDASLICVKRRTLDAVFDYMIQNNMIQDGPEGLKLAQESIVAINDIIRAHGFETACSTCYIDARRYRAAIVAGSFCNVYNKLVRSMLKGKTGVPINAFNFGGNKSVTPLANSLDTLSDSEINWDGINKAIRDQEAKWESKGWEKFTEDGEEKWRRNGTVKNLPTSGTTEYRIALALKEKPSLRKLALRSDFLSGNGFLELNRTNKDILTLYNVKKGQAGPKATETDIQYLHEALENSFITPDRMFKAGGFRLQSFSDYVPRLVFDYVEIIGDLAAKGVPAHMYTKEILCVLQHGLTGTKINMSLIPAMVKKGFAPGLDADGNYLWRDGQTFGSTAYSLSPKLEAHLSKILGYQVKGRLTGAQGFELAKLIQNDPAYGKNNGTIAIGVSEAQIRKMLDDADIRMVIPYHKSGLNHILASMMEIPGFENYESYQNTLKWNGTKWSKVDVDFDFNEAVQKHKGDARAAAQDYLDWCKENGYKPKFSGVASGSARNSYNKAYDFTQHADWQTGTMTGEAESNYYKVLADFTCYDAEGKISRQEAVKLNYPGTDSAFGSMKQLIEMGLESDAMLQAKQDAEVPKIVEDIRREIPKFEAAGRNMKAYAQLKENVDGRQFSERDNAKPRSAQAQRDAGYKLSESKFYSLYSAHKLNMTGKGNVQEQIASIMANGFKGDGGFGNNVMPTNISYDVDENGKRIPRGLSAQKYAPKKGEYILLVPKEGVEVKGGRYNFTERVKPGYKPAFDYEIVQADYDGQPYYEMYERAYDKSQAEKADVTLDKAQFSERDISKIQDEYEEALAAGDSDWQKMLVAQAAYNAGYTTGAYHGSPITDITEFNTRSEKTKKERLQLLFGTHFTQNKEYAKIYAKKAKTSKGTSRMSTKTGRIYDVYLDLGKSLDLWTAKNYTPGTEMYSLYEDLPDRIKRKVKPHTFTAYDTEIGLGSGNYISASTIERALQEMAPKEATGFLVDHGYNSVLYLADYSTGMANNRMTRDPSIIMLDPERIKSADPITRSQDGNIIPLTERFNPAKKDIRYSERDYSTPSDEELLMNASVEDAESPETRAALQNSQKQARQIRDLTRRLERLQTEIRGYEGDSPNRISVQQFTRQALDLFGIPSGVRTEMGELLQSVAEGVLAGHNLNQNDIMYFFETLITNGREKTVADETLAEIRDDLKGRKIYVNENVKAEFGDDWNAFRKRAFSLGIQLTNNEKNMGIDSVNAELAELYPGKFDADETDLRSILENIVDTAESGKTSEVPILDAMREIQKQTGEPVREQLQTMLDQFTRQIEIMQGQAAVERKARAGNAAEIAKARKQINEAKEALREVRKQRDAWKRKSEWADARQKRTLDAAMRNVIQHDAKQIAEAVRQKQALAKKLQDQIDHEKKILSGELRSPELAKLLKAERENAEARVKEQKEKVFQNYKERKKASDMRGRISSLKKDLQKSLLHPTDTNYVPAGLAKSIVDALDALDTSPKEGTQSAAKYAAISDKLRAVAVAYNDMHTSEEVGYEYTVEYDKELAKMISDLAKTMEGRNARDLSADELKTAYDYLRSIRDTMVEARKLLSNLRYESVREAIASGLEQQSKITPIDDVSKMERKKRLSVMDKRSPMRAVEFMSNMDRSAALYEAFQQVEAGDEQRLAWSLAYQNDFRELKSGKNEKTYWQSLTKQIDYGATDKKTGKPVTMTKMQAIQLFMTAQREAANKDLEHLFKGGTTIRNAKDIMEGKENIRSNEIFVTPELLKNIENSFTEWDRQYMDRMRDYLKREGKAVNKVFYELKHRVLPLEENYVPTIVDQKYLDAKLETTDFSGLFVKSPRSTQAITKGAPQPLIIDGMETMMNKHVQEQAQYIGMATAIRDFAKIFNGKVSTSENGVGYTSLKAEIERNFGKKGVHLITQALIDIQGGSTQSGWRSGLEKVIKKLQTSFVRHALLFNLSVTIKQAASYVAAGSIISREALLKGNRSILNKNEASHSASLITQIFLNPNGKTAQKIFARADKYTALHADRRNGMNFAEVELGQKNYGKLRQKAAEIGANLEQKRGGHKVREIGAALNPASWIQRMDVATTAALFVACEYQARMDGLEGEAYHAKVKELYERVLRETQPMYDSLHRTAQQKSGGSLAQYLFPFRTVPIQNHGQMASAYDRLLAAKTKSNTEKAEAAKFFRKTLIAQIESAVVFSAMTFAAALTKRKTKKYRDEDGELTLESVARGFGLDVASTLVSVASPMWGSELWSLSDRFINKFTGKGGYTYDSFSVGALDMINDTAAAIDKIAADVGKATRREDVSLKEFGSHMFSLLTKVGNLSGIPADTIKTYTEGFIGNIQDAIEGRIPALNDESWERDAATNARRYLKAYLNNDAQKASAVLAELRSTLSKSGKGEDKINEAIRKAVSSQAIEKVADGTWTEEEAEAYLLSTGAYDDRENPQKDAWNAIRKGVAKATSTDEEFNWKQYDELAEAVANGEDVTGLLAEYRDHGYSDDQINTAIRSGIQEALTAGDLDGNEAADALIRYGVTYSKDGKDVVYDEQAAWKKVQEWIDKAEHTDEDGEIEDGYKYSAYADLFDAVDANQNADGVIQTMVQNGGYDTDGLRSKIKEHLLERFVAGQITETALKNQLSRYCKITKSEDANEIVANAKCKRDFGVYPDDLKEAFKDGDLSQNQAEKALQQYKGLSKADAQNRVQYWGYDGDLSENAWAKWAHELKSTGLSVDNWEKVYKVKSSAKGTDANGDGRADSGTVKAEVVSYIDSMNIPKSQKKAIYLAFGWAASTMPNWR